MSKLSIILKFVIVNLLGFFSFGAVFYLAYFSGVIPSDLAGDDRGMFFTSFFGGTIWAWVAGFVISLGYFFAGDGKARGLLLWAAVYVPLAYAALNLTYFNTVPLRAATSPSTADMVSEEGKIP